MFLNKTLYKTGLCRGSSQVKINTATFLYSIKHLRPLAELDPHSGNEWIPRSPKPFDEIPGPRKYPVIGSSPFILSHKDFNLKNIDRFWGSLFDEFGPIIRIDPFMGEPLFAIWKPDDLQTVHRTNAENPVRYGFTSYKKVRYDSGDNSFKKKGGILVENYEEWKRVRSSIQPHMMKPTNLTKYLPQLDQIALDFNDKIWDLQTEHGEMPPDFIEYIYKWTLESISVVALNKRMGCLDKELPADSHQMQLINAANGVFKSFDDTEWIVKLWKLFPTPSIRHLQKCHDKIIELVGNDIREAEQFLKENPSAEGEQTLLETFLRAPQLDRKDVVAFVCDMLGAGVDTTSYATSFALYLLAKNPEVQRRLQEEVDKVLGDGKQYISDAHLARLSYLKACVKESLRIYPLVIGTTRVLQKDVVLSGYQVPKGVKVVLCSMITSRKESVFPRAKEFIPERWGPDQPLGPIHPCGSLPFSHGPRMCIGRRIAELEMYILVARIMHRFEVRYNHKDIESITGFVNTPSEPLQFEFIERK